MATKWGEVLHLSIQDREPPPVLRTWHLSKLSISELIQTPKNIAAGPKETVAKTKGRPRGSTTKEKTAKADTAANEVIVLNTSNDQVQTVET